MGDFKLDFKALINTMANEELLKQKEVAPVVKVCNKYGIFGTDFVQFIIELGEAAQQCNLEKDGE